MLIHLFCGFLGSGKTTLAMGLARQWAVREKRKVLLIVNDAGDVGIDAQLMRRLDAEVFELFGGCLCGQMGNIAKIFQRLGSDLQVDDVLIEASGIARPAVFLTPLRRFLPAGAVVKVTALADAVRWQELRQVLEPLVESQIRTADIVLINKADEASPEAVAEVYRDVRHLNPDAVILSVAVRREADIRAIAEVIRRV